MAIAERAEPKGGWPMFLGLATGFRQQYDAKRVQEIQDALDRVAVPGARCFLDVSPEALEEIRRLSKLDPEMISEFRGTRKPGLGMNIPVREFSTYQSFKNYFELVHLLDGRGVKIFPVERRRKISLLPAPEPPPHWTPVDSKYKASVRKWNNATTYISGHLHDRVLLRRVRSDAKPTDFVVTEPRRVQRLEWAGVPLTRVRIVDLPLAKALLNEFPESKSYIERLRRQRRLIKRVRQRNPILLERAKERVRARRKPRG